MFISREISDNELLRQIKVDDTISFELLYRRYKGKIYNFTMRLSNGDNYLSEEIVQNVFLRIWEMRKELKIEQSVSGFFFTVAKNIFLNIVQRRVRESLHHELMLEQYSEESDNNVEQEMDLCALKENIHELIEQLPPARRRVFELSRLEYLSNKEIATQLNISENTVESNLYKAGLFMKKRLSERYNGLLNI